MNTEREYTLTTTDDRTYRVRMHDDELDRIFSRDGFVHCDEWDSGYWKEDVWFNAEHVKKLERRG